MYIVGSKLSLLTSGMTNTILFQNLPIIKVVINIISSQNLSDFHNSQLIMLLSNYFLLSNTCRQTAMNLPFKMFWFDWTGCWRFSIAPSEAREIKWIEGLNINWIWRLYYKLKITHKSWTDQVHVGLSLSPLKL